MNALLCIGIDSYQHLGNLYGAEKDATDVFRQLCSTKDYDEATSKLLISPHPNEITTALHDLFSAASETDVFTFYFAGHGMVKAGSFYLCTANSIEERLSTTAFSIVTLFSIINEIHPSQVNIIIDACQAGGASFDLNQLLKPESIGSSSASSISFLGGCAANEYASETEEGGFLTREFLKCLSGQIEIQGSSPFLDLIGVGAVVCQNVNSLNPQQRPISWGLSLFGSGRLAANPHFQRDSAERAFPISSVSPQSEIGKSARNHTSELWDEYRHIQEDVTSRRLFNLLASIVRDSTDENDIISFCQGVIETMAARCEASSDLFSPIICYATELAFLLERTNSENITAYAEARAQHLARRLDRTFDQLLALMQSDDDALINRPDLLADLYFLPLRITKILGWIGALSILAKLMKVPIPAEKCFRSDIVERILSNYPSAIASVSDEQAPFLYVFFTACRVYGKTELSKEVLTRYFASFASRGGKIARCKTDGVGALNFIRSLGPPQLRHPRWRPANPSFTAPVLLHFGRILGFGADWDLRSLDRLRICCFLPTDYRDFANEVMAEGLNHTHQIGFGIWNLADFDKEFRPVLLEHSKSCNLPPVLVFIATISSLLFPDRIPFILENCCSHILPDSSA